MDYIHLALAGAANFTFIALRAFQQRNVVHNDYGLVFITANLIALVEVFVVFTIASKGFMLPLVFTLGVSGGLGCIFAMRFHNWLMVRNHKRETAEPSS